MAYAGPVWNIVAAKELTNLQTVLHQHAFITMTFQIMPGIGRFNAHIRCIMPFEVFGADA